MAEKILNTRLQVLNDTAAALAAKSSAVPLKGEIVYENDTRKMKIGDGVTALGDLKFVGGDEAQNFNATATAEQTDMAAITAAVGSTEIHKGDTAIVQRVISGDKKSYTAYVYNGTAWEAMDGNYSADNVYFDEDITLAGDYTTVGNLTKSQNGTAPFSVNGKSVKQAFVEMLSKIVQPGTPTQPSVSLTFANAKAYEVGTPVKVSYSSSLNPGSYTFGPETGVTVSSWEITDTAGHTATTASGSFDDVVVADNTNYKITVKANYTQGAIAYNNMKKPSDPIVRIAAGYTSKVSEAITGYRNTFYGTRANKDELTSDIIRALTKSNAAYANGKTFNISVPVGAQRVVFAYPATLRDVSSVKDVNGMNAEIKSSFTKSTMTVAGNGSDAGIEYKVYVTDFAEPIAAGKANTYAVTI